MGESLDFSSCAVVLYFCNKKSFPAKCMTFQGYNMGPNLSWRSILYIFFACKCQFHLFWNVTWKYQKKGKTKQKTIHFKENISIHCMKSVTHLRNCVLTFSWVQIVSLMLIELNMYLDIFDKLYNNYYATKKIGI